MRRTVIGLFFLSIAQRAGAQSKDDAEMVVVTGTRTPERAQRSTVKTDVVTREDAERRGATNVAEALQSQPGVMVNPGAYGDLGGISAIQIQGLDRDRVLVLEDGERIVGDIGGAIDLSSIPITDLARIEIVTGPTSSLYGASAIGGVVNVITAPPSKRGPSGGFRIEGRSQPGFVLGANGAWKRDDAWIRLDASWVGTGAISRVPGLPDRTLPEIQRRMIGVRGGTRLGRSDLRLRARFFDDRSDGLQSTMVPGLGTYLTDLPNETRRWTLHAIDVVDLGKGSNLRVTLGTQLARNEGAIDRRDSPVDQLRNRDSGMQSFEAVTTVADGARTWVVGTRFEAERYAQRLTRTDASPSGLVTTTGDEVVPQMFGNGAGYAQLAWKFPLGITALAGVRGEGHTRYGGAIAPRAAIAWKPNDAWQVRVSGGRGFRAPSAKELGFVFDHSVFGYRVLGNPDLRPETSWGVNGDVTWSPSRQLFVRTGAFANFIDDLIDIDLANGMAGGSGSVVDYAYRNIGKARTAGIQLAVGFRTKRLRADLAYDYLFTRDDIADAPLGGRPPHTVTASIHLEPIGALQIDARMRVATDAYVSDTLRSPGWESIDLRVGHPVWRGSLAYAGVIDVADVHQDPGRVGDLRPPVGRIFHAGLRADFPWEEGDR